MDYSKELSPELREKMKKNLVYVGIFAVVMFFAGLTSAYYVNMGGGFWLKYPMPSGFYLSTLFIGCSSLFFVLAIRAIKQGKSSLLKLHMALTLVFGLLFVTFQFKGYNQLIELKEKFNLKNLTIKIYNIEDNPYQDKVHKITALQANTVVSCIHALRDGNETDDIISEDMLPVGISPIGLFQNTDYNLTPIITT